MLVEEFVKFVDLRESVLEKNKDKIANMTHDEKWDWYEENVRAIDWKIVRLANRIMRQDFHANTTTFIRLRDVFESEELTELYNDVKVDSVAKDDGKIMPKSLYERE